MKRIKKACWRVTFLAFVVSSHAKRQACTEAESPCEAQFLGFRGEIHARKPPSKNRGERDTAIQPSNSPISQEQLIAEVKGIYAGLVMVEGKCIEVDAKQYLLLHAGGQPMLNSEQYQALIALHRTSLHVHHESFLASQHPCASPEIKRLAHKYAIPARMWRHGIHSFLQLLSHRPPYSQHHMIAFINVAISMMALSYETAPAFEHTWIECLGDLSRYQIAIKDDDIRDKQVWIGVARHWYSKVSDRAPTAGRLYHHLGILAIPNILQQLFCFEKVLRLAQPFNSAKESMLSCLLEPALRLTLPGKSNSPIDAVVKLHTIVVTQGSSGAFNQTFAMLVDMLDSYVRTSSSQFPELSSYIAIANCFAVLGFGSIDGSLAKSQCWATGTQIPTWPSAQVGIWVHLR